MKKVNIAFTCIFSFVGLSFLYICTNFVSKYYYYRQFDSKINIHNVRFYFNHNEANKGLIFASYSTADKKEIHEPVFVHGRVCTAGSQEAAELIIQDLASKNWVAYTSQSGKTSINKPQMPVKDGVYTLLCIIIAIYFYLLRVSVLRKI